jgi:hypothetical protein
VAESVVSVYSSPLWCSCQRSWCLARLVRESITCKAVMPWASADVADALPLSKSLWMDRSSPSLARAIKSSWIGWMGDEGMSSTSRCPLPLLVGAFGVVMTAGLSRLDGEAPSLAVMSGG